MSYDYKRFVVAEAAPDEEEESSGAQKGVSALFLMFLDETDGQRVRNPDTGRQVKIKSLGKTDGGQKLQKKLYQEWLKKHKSEEKGKSEKGEESKSDEGEEKGKSEKGEEKGEKDGILELPEGRFDNIKFKISNKKEVRKRLGLGKDEDIGEACADMIGISALQAASYGGEISITVDLGWRSVEIKAVGPHIEEMTRQIHRDLDDNVAIYNDTLKLADSAPSGLGTKILASQVFAAKKMGVSQLSCTAYRDDPDWVGYKVWPKLGYDGLIPHKFWDKGGLKKWKKKLGEKFPPPWMVSHLLAVGGAEIWGESGDSFDAVFSLADGSPGLQVLGEYVEKRAKRDKTSPQEWLTKSAAKKPKGKNHEETDLDDAGHAILDKLWKGRKISPTYTKRMQKLLKGRKGKGKDRGKGKSKKSHTLESQMPNYDRRVQAAKASPRLVMDYDLSSMSNEVNRLIERMSTLAETKSARHYWSEGVEEAEARKMAKKDAQGYMEQLLERLLKIHKK